MSGKRSDKSLILGLYEKFVSGSHEAETGTTKYAPDTQTLYTNPLAVHSSIGNSAAVRNEIAVNSGFYERLAREDVHYIVVKDLNLLPGTEVIFREVDGLKQTGRYIVKRILHIATPLDVEGLMAGYYILSW